MESPLNGAISMPKIGLFTPSFTVEGQDMHRISLLIGLEIEMNDLFSKKDLEESVACYATLAMKVAGEEESLRKQLKKAKKKIRKQEEECESHYQAYASTEKEAERLHFEMTDYKELRDDYEDLRDNHRVLHAKSKEQETEIADLKWVVQKLLAAQDANAIEVKDLQDQNDGLRQQIKDFWGALPADVSNKPTDEAIAILRAKLFDREPDNPAEESYW
jgi:chromosome segregation ATPase